MSNKLMIKHFPKQMSLQEREQFLCHFGAIKTVIFPDNSKLRNSAYAYFNDEYTATNALYQMHQMQVYETRLVVEWAKDNTNTKLEEEVVEAYKAKSVIYEELEQFWDELNFVSPKLNLKYPPNIAKYNYPPPNKLIITNIAIALLKCPDFYTQVLHLMNKMNMIPPFYQSYANFCEAPKVSGHFPSSKSEEEEEEEEEKEKDHQEQEQEIVENETLLQDKHFCKRQKKILSTGIVGKHKDKIKAKQINSRQCINCEEIFDKVNKTNINDIKINIKQLDLSNLSNQNFEKQISFDGFGKIDFKRKEENVNEENCKIIEFITEQELKEGKLSNDEYHKYPLIQKYNLGSQSSRIYIKNIAKSVEVDDLKRIYGRYVNWDNEKEQDMFHIQLFKEGKLRGQAFISLPNEERAMKAIEETNTFVLKDKPIIVCFARSAQPKNPNG